LEDLVAIFMCNFVLQPAHEMRTHIHTCFSQHLLLDQPPY